MLEKHCPHCPHHIQGSCEGWTKEVRKAVNTGKKEGGREGQAVAVKKKDGRRERKEVETMDGGREGKKVRREESGK